MLRTNRQISLTFIKYLLLCKQMSNSCQNESHFAVKHDLDKKEFFINFPTGKAFLNYEFLKSSTLDLYHTEVPEALRGQGIARSLAEAAFSYVAENDLSMKLSCWYLQDYIKKYPKPEYIKRVVSE